MSVHTTRIRAHYFRFGFILFPIEKRSAKNLFPLNSRVTVWCYKIKSTRKFCIIFDNRFLINKFLFSFFTQGCRVCTLETITSQPNTTCFHYFTVVSSALGPSWKYDIEVYSFRKLQCVNLLQHPKLKLQNFLQCTLYSLIFL